MKFLPVILLLSSLALLTGCFDESTKDTEARKSRNAANEIQFTVNAERENIVKRLKLTSDPALTGFIVLLSEAGTPIAYHSVVGKVTSSGKRLTNTAEASGNGYALPSASDEGTYGSSDPYIYFWTAQDEYIQWSGKYLYSDKPIRLRQEPLVISVK